MKWQDAEFLHGSIFLFPHCLCRFPAVLSVSAISVFTLCFRGMPFLLNDSRLSIWCTCLIPLPGPCMPKTYKDLGYKTALWKKRPGCRRPSGRARAQQITWPSFFTRYWIQFTGAMLREYRPCHDLRGSILSTTENKKDLQGRKRTRE